MPLAPNSSTGCPSSHPAHTVRPLPYRIECALPAPYRLASRPYFAWTTTRGPGKDNGARYNPKLLTGFGVERRDVTEGPRYVHAAVHHQRHGFYRPAAGSVGFVSEPVRPHRPQPGNVLHINLLQRGVSLSLMIVTDIWPVGLRMYGQERNENGESWEADDSYRRY
jgi:hypothetical protein